MEHLRSDNPPIAPRVLTALLLLSGSGTAVYQMITHDVFTPEYANSFSIFWATLCHVGIVVSIKDFQLYLSFIFSQIGPAALFGFRAANFRLYPQKYAYLVEQQVHSNMLARAFTSRHFNTFLVPMMCFLTLTQVDQLHEFMVVPATLWLLLAYSSIVAHQRLLIQPLWFTRHFSYFAAFAFVGSFSLCYRQFAHRIEYRQMSSSMANV